MPSGMKGTQRLGEFRKGWPVLLGCLIGQGVGIHTLPPYTIGLFISPLGEDLGWSRTSISIGVLIVTLGIALSAPFAGGLVNRTGERPLIVVGMCAVACGYLALGMTGHSITYYWAILFLMAVFGVGCTPITLSRVLIASFDKARGTALGISLIGTGLAGTLPPLILAPVMAAYGWRAGFIVLACVVAIAWPIILGLFALGGAARAVLPSKDVRAAVGFREALRQPLMTRLLAAFFCIAVATGGVVVHFSPMLVDSGYSLLQATQLASLIGISILTGRLLTGIAVDRIFAPRVAAVLMGASAIGFASLSLASSAFLPAAAFLVGMSLGAEIDLVMFVISRYYPPRVYGRTFGILYSIFLVGVAASPIIYARLYELAGNYQLAFVWAAVFLGLSSILFATLPRFPAEPHSST